MSSKIIEVHNCYECPYADSGFFIDRCKILQNNYVIDTHHKKTIKDNCPLKDKE